MRPTFQIYSITIDNGAGGGSPANTVRFRPIFIMRAGDQAAERQGSNLLEELAEKAGGLYFHTSNDARATEGVVKAGQALRNEYLIGYLPAAAERSGKYHRIHVKSTVSKANVHARAGYYGLNSA